MIDHYGFWWIMSDSSNLLARPIVIGELTLAERLLLVEQIWDSIAAEQESAAVTPGQAAELERRLEAYRESPAEGASWEEVKTRLRSL